MGNKHKPLSASGAKAEENARDMNASLKSSDAGTAAAAGGSSEAEGAEVAKGAEGTIGNRDEIQDYILSEPDETHREALAWFIAYMGKTHPGLKPVISYGIPTYKLGGKRRYVAFSLAKDHYTFHSTDFDIIDELRGKIPGAGKGRGSIHLKYDDPAVWAVVVAAIAAIVSRKGD